MCVQYGLQEVKRRVIYESKSMEMELGAGPVASAYRF